MQFQKLTLLNFKSYETFEMSFDDKIICFTGNNGIGKTNLLDALFHFSFAKSYFNAIDTQNIRFGAEFYVLQSNILKENQVDHVTISFRKNQGKTIKRNQKEIQRISDFAGIYPVVMVAPNDSSLIYEGSEERRRLMDMIISVYDHHYLEALMRYNRILAQRNAHLKSTGSQPDETLLDIWDSQLCETGQFIHIQRKAFIAGFIDHFRYFYRFIASADEQTRLEYQSQLLSGSFDTMLKSARNKDKITQFTSVGIHKDDLDFSIMGYPLKKAGSQGQQKTFILALKLAQFRFIQEKCKEKPVLLFDDVFDKLDIFRIEKLFELIGKDTFGQIFITDTNTERVNTIFNKAGIPVHVIQLDL